MDNLDYDVTKYLKPLEQGDINPKTLGLALELCNDKSRVRSSLSIGYRNLAESESEPELKKQYIEVAEALNSGKDIIIMGNCV
jgi:hypothetical protein